MSQTGDGHGNSQAHKSFCELISQVGTYDEWVNEFGMTRDGNEKIKGRRTTHISSAEDHRDALAASGKSLLL